MNQIMPVGKGILIAVEDRMTSTMHDNFTRKWQQIMPDVPVILINAQFVLEGDIGLFQFTGDVSATVIAEFQRWWEEVNRPETPVA